ncbi:hypothetical protein CRM22_006799 [Opisthorchis felineus]|uniref:Uncharacterized protein n=1 Tax=Opisthorchis felineus TaxID=147828 RepID=A0A4S2LL40_OPIFE|nr:hypothetical protein CRM22_006799 [Opisthorchis felineus]
MRQCEVLQTFLGIVRNFAVLRDTHQVTTSTLQTVNLKDRTRLARGDSLSQLVANDTSNICYYLCSECRRVVVCAFRCDQCIGAGRDYLSPRTTDALGLTSVALARRSIRVGCWFSCTYMSFGMGINIGTSYRFIIGVPVIHQFL